MSDWNTLSGFGTENRIHSNTVEFLFIQQCTSRKTLGVHTLVQELGEQKSGGQLLLVLPSHLLVSWLPIRMELVTGHGYTYIYWDLLAKSNSSWNVASVFLPTCIVLAEPKLYPKL